MEPIEQLVNPRAMDYYANLGHIYFADTTSFLIGRQKLDGSGRETILKDGGYTFPYEFRKLYYFVFEYLKLKQIHVIKNVNQFNWFFLKNICKVFFLNCPNNKTLEILMEKYVNHSYL